MKDYGLVSVIMPNYNGSEFIMDAVKSVLRQTYVNFELIVIDDYSSDDSLSLLDYYLDSRLKILKNDHNLGPGGSRNRGIKAASGRFLAFLDSDDVWYPEKLEKQIKYMVSHDVAFTCHGYDVCEDTMDNVVKTYMPPARVTYDDVLKNNTIGCLSAMIDVSKVGKVLMPEHRDTREDMVTWLKVLEECKACFSVGEILGKYRMRSRSYSGNKRKLLKVQYRMYRNDLGFSCIMSAKYLIINIIEKLVNKY